MSAEASGVDRYGKPPTLPIRSSKVSFYKRKFKWSQSLTEKLALEFNFILAKIFRQRLWNNPRIVVQGLFKLNGKS